MSIDGTNPTSGTQGTDQTGAAEENTQPKGTPPPSSQSSSQTVGNMGKLQEESPEVYKKMLEAMFQDINKQQTKHEEKMKKIRQESNRSS
jgi:hypothetical protein